MFVNRMIRFRRRQIGVFSVLLFTIGAFTGFSASVMAHGSEEHKNAVAKSDAESVQQFAVETLRIPNVPVIDASHITEGFVSRFAGAGTIIISPTYTGCKTICPVSNIVLQELDKALVEQSELPIQIVTVSIDPQSDTPDVLRATADLLGSSDRWTWLTATAQHSRMLLNSLDVDVTSLEEHDPTFLVGNVSTGRFIRVIGLPDPDQLLAISQSEQL